MIKKYDLIPIRVKQIFSGFCLFLVIVHMIFPKTIDWVSVALLGLALIPWFIHFIKGIELPGGTKLEFGTFQQTTAEIPAPSSQTSPSMPSDDLLLNPHVVKTLKTLWKYQQEYYSNDPVKRWVFKVTPPAPEFGDYLESVVKLYKTGCVTLSPKEGFCMLTNEGISFCKQNSDKLKITSASEIYRF